MLDNQYNSIYIYDADEYIIFKSVVRDTPVIKSLILIKRHQLDKNMDIGIHIILILEKI